MRNGNSVSKETSNKIDDREQKSYEQEIMQEYG